MMSVATAVAGKAAEAVADGGKAALTALVHLVRDHLGKNKAAANTLARARTAPHDPAAIQRLATVLEDAARVDADFGRQLQALWPQAQTELSAHDGGVINTSTGMVSGHLIQARDIHVQGGLHLGDVS
jgi:hypothetical protein